MPQELSVMGPSAAAAEPDALPSETETAGGGADAGPGGIGTENASAGIDGPESSKRAGNTPPPEVSSDYQPREAAGRPEQGGYQAEIAAGAGLLVEVALRLDDPVAALEEGVEALAEALAQRDLAVQEQHRLERAVENQREARQAEFQQAYRHARLHRVGELVDLGYSLDQAVAITTANEAEIRQRAASAGRDPAEIIYRYALMHGYQPRRTNPSSQAGEIARDVGSEPRMGVPPRNSPSVLAGLAIMSDTDFAEATRGDRWQRLLRSN